MKYDVISPDGIPIENNGGYNSIEEANVAFIKWKKMFEHQGYYSSISGRISLEDLKEKCRIIEINKTMEYKILKSTSANGLTEKVTLAISEGWLPIGSHQVVKTHEQLVFVGSQHRHTTIENTYTQTVTKS
jgi:hypothetical protein